MKKLFIGFFVLVIVLLLTVLGIGQGTSHWGITSYNQLLNKPLILIGEEYYLQAPIHLYRDAEIADEPVSGLQMVSLAFDLYTHLSQKIPLVDISDPTNINQLLIVNELGWAIPSGFNTTNFATTSEAVLDSDYSSKGVLLSATGESIPTILEPPATTGYVLSYDSSTPTGLKWKACTCGN